MNQYDKEYSRELTGVIGKINSLASKKAKKELIGYFNHLKENKTRDARIITLLRQSMRFYDILNKPISEANKDDARKIVEFADKGKTPQGKDWGEVTKSNFKQVYKQYRKWLTGNIDFPDDVRWIKGKVLLDYRQIEEVTPNSIMKVEDFKKFISSCDHPRDKALFSLIGELGLRPKEALLLKIKNVDLTNKELAMITVPSDTKTGSRTVPAIFCKKWLAEWILKFHPYKDKKESWLFPQKIGKEERPLSYSGLEFIFNEIKVRAGFNKKFSKFTPYQFRKFSYTFKAGGGWSDQQLKAFHGLQPKSKAIDVYVKLDPKDLVDNMKELYGLKVVKDKGKVLSVITCPSCKTQQPDSNKQCEECGLILDLVEANKKTNELNEKNNNILELQKQINNLTEMQNKLMKAMRINELYSKQNSKE